MTDSKHWNWAGGFCTLHRGQSLPCHVCIDTLQPDIIREEAIAAMFTHWERGEFYTQPYTRAEQMEAGKRWIVEGRFTPPMPKNPYPLNKDFDGECIGRKMFDSPIQITDGETLRIDYTIKVDERPLIERIREALNGLTVRMVKDGFPNQLASFNELGLNEALPKLEPYEPPTSLGLKLPIDVGMFSLLMTQQGEAADQARQALDRQITQWLTEAENAYIASGHTPEQWEQEMSRILLEMDL